MSHVPWKSTVVASLFLGLLAVVACDREDVPPAPDMINVYDDTPLEVLGFEPREGLASDQVTITGSGFIPSTELTEVYIGGARLPVVSASDTMLVVSVPVHAANGPITVADAGGRRAATTVEIFEVKAPDGLDMGYTGDAGEPAITWDLPEPLTVTPGATSVFIAGDVTGSEGQGYWAIIETDGVVRSQGYLPLAGTSYLQELPLFCGSQDVLLYFQNETGRGFYRAQVNRDGCTEDGTIRVKLSWETDGTDVDTHLLRPGGTYTGGDGSDCYYANSHPDWGVEGDPSDDPELDVDDTNGYGPENIYITPSEDGTYTVIIHYFSDHGEGPSNPWVEIFVHGDRVASFGPERMTSGGRWNVCRIDWPSGQVQATY